MSTINIGISIVLFIFLVFGIYLAVNQDKIVKKDD